MVNYLLNSMGNNLIIQKTDCVNLKISPEQTSVSLDVTKGYMIIDKTLINIPDTSSLSYDNLNTLPYDSDSRIVVHANYQYLQTLEDNPLKFKISHISPDGNTILPEGWQTRRDNIILGIFEYTLDGSDNITSFDYSEDKTITILGNEYTLYGFSEDNIHFNKIFDHLNTIEVSTLRIDQLKPPESDSTDINVSISYPGLVPILPDTDQTLYLTSDGTWEIATGSGLGNVAGPDSHTSGLVPSWDGSDTKKLSSGYIIDQSGEDITDEPNHIPNSQALIEYTSNPSNLPDASNFKLSDLAPPDSDNTDLYVSDSSPGLIPPIPNDSSKFFDGTGNYRNIIFSDITDKISLDQIDGFDDNNEDLLANGTDFGLMPNLSGDSNQFLGGDGSWISLPEPTDYILDELGPPLDTTRLNTNTLTHGLCPKLSGDTNQFLNGNGAFSTVIIPEASNFKLDELGSPTDSTDLDVLTTAHGLCPKLPDDETKYLNGIGGYTIPQLEFDISPKLGGDLNGNDKLIRDFRLRNYVETYYNNGDVYGDVVLDASYNVHIMVVTGNITSLTIDNLISGYSHSVVLRMYDAGSYAITWDSEYRFTEGEAPELTINGYDFLTFVKLDSGINVFMSGLDMKAIV